MVVVYGCGVLMVVYGGVWGWCIVVYGVGVLIVVYGGGIGYGGGVLMVVVYGDGVLVVVYSLWCMVVVY